MLSTPAIIAASQVAQSRLWSNKPGKTLLTFAHPSKLSNKPTLKRTTLTARSCLIEDDHAVIGARMLSEPSVRVLSDADVVAP